MGVWNDIHWLDGLIFASLVLLAWAVLAWLER